MEIFFVISGFLITYLLLKEFRKTGTTSLRGFYARRVLRIFPAYFLYLIVAISVLKANAVPLPLSSIIGPLTFTSNYFWPPPALSHIWSLSVEEQFYLLWPPILWMLLAGLAKRPDSSPSRSFFRVATILFVPILLCPITRILLYRHMGGTALTIDSFLCRADLIAWGCLLACACAFHGKAVSAWVERYRTAILSFALLVLGATLLAMRFFVPGFITVPFGMTLNAIGIALLLLVSIAHAERPAFAWLNWRPLTILGVGSYSLYLWQQIFCSAVAR